MKNIKIIYLLFILNLPLLGQKNFTIAAFNAENLFDHLRNKDKKYPYNDAEFTPENGWTKEKFEEKSLRVAHTLNNLNGLDGNIPDLVAFVEVENEKVLNEINKNLNKNAYPFIHITRGPDIRGINLAVMSKYPFCRPHVEKRFKPSNLTRPTRPILVVTVCVQDKPISVIINHWPSRWGGTEKSEPGRVAMAKQVRRVYEELNAKDPLRPIIITGDFNDEPENNSLYRYLQADDLKNKSELYNLSFEIANFINSNENYRLRKLRGSYNYRGTWNALDQMIINDISLEKKSIISYIKKSFQPSLHPYTSQKGNTIRFLKSKGGDIHPHGLSDHLPVTAKFKINAFIDQLNLEKLITNQIF